MASVKAAYTTKELVELLQVDAHTSVTRRAAREGWQSRPRHGRGGGHEWLLDSMPETTRQLIASTIASRIAKNTPAYPRISPDMFTVNTVRNIPEHKRKKATARAFLASMAGNFRRASGSTRTTAYEVFCHEYNRGAIEAPEWVRQLVPAVCRKSLTNWEERLIKRGLKDLTGKQGQHRKGTGLIDSTPGMADVIVAHIVKFYDEAAEEVLNALKVTHKGQPLPSLRNLQRWMKHWRADNPRTLLKVQNPDGFRSRHQTAFGSRSADVTRLNQLWELDSSPADVLLTDGKRYSLVGGISVDNRRARLKLARTSNTQAVCSLLRRMFLDFGIPETVKMDNGAEYSNFRVSSVLFDLGIDVEYCTPFTPEEKPHIERFFGTFQRRLKALPGFIGHSVADRKAIESQRSFAERISRKRGVAETKTLWELPLTPEEFQAFCDTWCEDVYGERKHSALRMSPNEAAARAALETSPRRITDERALDILLMPIPGDDGRRFVRKDGILAGKGTYIAPQLGSMVGDEVLVRLDEDNAGYIYVFTLDGIFLCRAEDPTLTGVSRRDIALAAKRVQKAVENRKVKEAKKLVAKVRPQELIPHILEMQQQEAQANREERTLRLGAEPSREFTSPALEQAALAAASRQLGQPAPMTPEEEAARAAFEARYALPKVKPETTIQDLTGREAFWMALKLEERLQRKEPLTPEQAKFLHGYQGSHFYQSWRAQYDRHGDSLFDGIDMAVAL